ncbi:nucleoside-diphosphate sugar epimerase/dehydratase [Corynebacterium gerontici]|uniref:UDP-N-acetyl-alpha-D-glucosamine C6 dehydratase n=1 Tax=Corynebacterium gerontici TaxID=2079234 RepID=A0A3G6IXR0_9CORY|nr:nucleoside-diphosphate sugar epimerase/dehydratase [Corynebacterium gerontici]AZA10426.1 UDP-N-acetyl-alpha-D-glucosamine C6 dehydratase [Corynebacterium gerontici]
MKNFAWRRMLLDVMMWMPAILAAIWLRLDFDPIVIHLGHSYWPLIMAVIMISHGALGWAFGVYRRGGENNVHISRTNVILAAAAALIAGVLGFVVAVALYPNSGMPRTVPMLAAPIVVCLVLFLRATEMLVAQVREQGREPVVLYGATQLGRHFIAQLAESEHSEFIVKAVLDDDPQRRGGLIHGMRVRGGLDDLLQVAEKTGAETLVIADSGLSDLTMDRIREAAREAQLRVLAVPSMAHMEGLSLGNLEDIDVSKFMDREQATLDKQGIRGIIEGKRVLVTGAGGSIGSELCRQVYRFGPAKLFMLDRDEGGLHHTQLSLTGKALLDDDTVILADIRDEENIRELFEQLRPEVVIHAAALKHQPLLERYPDQAWKTNVLGTEFVLRAAEACGAAIVVNVSTDKAANPCCVLGDSKRVAERLTAARAHDGASGRWVSVRFGNVLGSRGSVVETFMGQIKRGNSLTITDPSVRRYFMTIPEAAQLVLQAALVGRSGETLVLDMGEPMFIEDLARGLMSMAGRNDLGIVYTGLRPGEKMSEELFDDRETATHGDRHPLVSEVSVEPLNALPEGENVGELMRQYARAEQQLGAH